MMSVVSPKEGHDPARVNEISDNARVLRLVVRIVNQSG